MSGKYANARAENNVDFFATVVDGKYEIPFIRPMPYEEIVWKPFNYAKSMANKREVGCHFFVDDYQFKRLWAAKDKYLPMLSQFKAVMSPDYSTFTDYPKVIQIFNHYRKHLLAAWMQENHILVYPTISWGDESSYEWCFDGEPVGATVCVSSVGTQGNKTAKRLFVAGYEKMMERLEPETILFYGAVPEECEGNIVHIEPYQQRLRRIKND